MDVVTSPEARDVSEIPCVPLMDYIFANVRSNLPRLASHPWLVDVMTGNTIKFGEVEEQSRRLASSLSRLGFKQGDVLYFVTYEMTYVFLTHLAVWRLGGTMRGWQKVDDKGEHTRQMRDSRPCFVLVDDDTENHLREAADDLDWKIQWLSVGDPGRSDTLALKCLLEDDGSALPDHVVINPIEDVVSIPSTSGSTGYPKGVLHTHFTYIASIHGKRIFFSSGQSIMSSLINNGSASLLLALSSLCEGITVYYIGKFSKETYFNLLLKYKPENIILSVLFAQWFARSPELDRVDLSFLRAISMAAMILDPSTIQLLSQRLPHVHLEQTYGMTECLIISTTELRKDVSKPLVIVENRGQQCVSTGRLCPYVRAKVVDTESGKPVTRGDRGEIMIHSPSVMKGYLSPGHAPNRSDVDEDGWLHTGDFGFIDEDGNIFVNERLNFMYKYQTVPVLPSEIEAVLQEHPAVLCCGVVGVPDPETDNLSRAYVVLRPECQVTPEELQEHVAQRLPFYKRLHGGVRFIDKLPDIVGKLDRPGLKRMALQENATK